MKDVDLRYLVPRALSSPWFLDHLDDSPIGVLEPGGWRRRGNLWRVFWNKDEWSLPGLVNLDVGLTLSDLKPVTLAWRSSYLTHGHLQESIVWFFVIHVCTMPPRPPTHPLSISIAHSTQAAPFLCGLLHGLLSGLHVSFTSCSLPKH